MEKEIKYEKKFYSAKKPDGSGEIEYWTIEEPVRPEHWNLGGRNKKILTKDEWIEAQGLKESVIKKVEVKIEDNIYPFCDLNSARSFMRRNGIQDFDIDKNNGIMTYTVTKYKDINEAFNREEMTPKFDVALLDKWIADLNQHEIDKGYAFPVSYDYSKGGKYIKVFSQYNGKDKSVFAFVDADGNIYKPAGWNAPAKGIRARIDENPPLDGIQLYSSKYLKGAYGIR